MKLLQQFLSQHFSYHELLFFCFDNVDFHAIYQNLPKPPKTINVEIIENQLKPHLLTQILNRAQQPNLKVKLETWAKQRKPKEYAEMIPPKEIPVVIAAMRRTQFNETIKNPKIKELFNQLVTMLGWSLDDLKRCYGTKPSDWKPWQGDKVQDILSETELFLTHYKNEYNLKLVDKSDIFFDETTRRVIEVQEFILIIDALSMYHEEITTYLNDAGVFSSNNKILVLVISPIMETAFTVGQRLQDDIYNGKLTGAFKQFDTCNQFFTFHINHKRVLQQLLLAMSPHIHQAGEVQNRRSSLMAYIKQEHKAKKRDVDNVFIPK